MTLSWTFWLLAGSLDLAQAVPSGTTNSARAICTPAAGGSASIDDAPAIASAIASCGNGGTIVIPEGSTYHLNSVLSFAGCEDCDFQVEGLLKFASDLDYWKDRTAILDIKNINGLKLRSLTGKGVMDGNGQNAWDKFAADSSYRRPTLLYVTGGSNLEFSNFRLKNPPNVFVSVKGGTTNSLFSKLRMDANSKSNNLPKNTDGYDIGESTYVTIRDATVQNHDDCVAFKPSANDVTVNTITCTGSHGMSVGSLGKASSDFVKNIYVTGATMINSTKAAGIKTYPGGGGHGVNTVSNVTFDDFTVVDCDYAFHIESCYGEEAEYCAANPGKSRLTDIVVKRFRGTTSARYAPTTANLNCAKDGICGVKISDWKVNAPSGTNKILCNNTPSNLGVTCTPGASG
jgi:galacturan 1,4-alpha-galacturonidase